MMSRTLLSWPMPDLNKSHKIWKLESTIVLSAVGIFSKIMLDYFTKVKVHNRKVIIEALDNRPSGQPLLTVSNHHSCLDEPLLWGILDYRHLCNQPLMRWTAGAHDVCFTKRSHSKFFSLGKTFPIERGKGVYQNAMNFCIEVLNRGEWAHFFPEGKVNENPDEFLRLKWGIGRLIAESNVVPLVIPFWHQGMDSVLPNTRPYIPQIGKKVTILFGNPIDFTEIREKLKEQNMKSRELRKYFTDAIQKEFAHLREECAKNHLQHQE